MFYGAETLRSMKLQEKKLDVTEKRMLRWICGMTNLDEFRNEGIRGTVKLTEISQRRLQWYEHVMTRDWD